MKRVWGGVFFGPGTGKLVKHGGAGWRCTKRRPAPTFPLRTKGMTEITDGRILTRKWVPMFPGGVGGMRPVRGAKDSELIEDRPRKGGLRSSRHYQDGT